MLSGFCVHCRIKAEHVAEPKPNNCTWDQLLNSSKPNTREDTKGFLMFVLAQGNVYLAQYVCVYSGLQYAVYIFVCEKVCEIMCE